MKNSLLPYPSVLQDLIKPFGGIFTKPQFANFQQAIGGLIFSSSSSISRMAHLFDKKHQTSLDRFFIESPWEILEIKQPLARLTSRFLEPYTIGIIDDTLSHKKHAKKMDMLGFHFDNLNKDYSWGHSIVTSGYWTRGQFMPQDIEVYQREETLKDKAEFKTKNQIACEIIEEMVKQKKLFCFTFDSWYSNSLIISRIKAHQKHYVTQIKSNRNVTISNRRVYAREHAKFIEENKFRECKIDGRKFKVFSCSAHIESIGSVLIVFSKMQKGSEWGDTHYLITDMLNMSEESIIRIYLRRGSIESFHREAKQHLGLESYQLRKRRGIERYLFLVMLAYAFLVMLMLSSYGKQKMLETIGEACRALKADCYTNLLKAARHADIEEIIGLAKELALAA